MTSPSPSFEDIAVDPQVDAVAEGLWAVRIPLHVRVEPVNAYVARDPAGGYVVLDTGLAVGALNLWRTALESIEPGAAQNVSRIIVSHHHPDHIGGAGALHELTGLPLHASRSTIEQAPGVWGDEGRMEQYFVEMREHYARHGVPDDIVRDLDSDLLLARAGVRLPPDEMWLPLDAGAELEFAGATWVVHDTPGHADGHIVLFDPVGRRLLSADHLLERISPAVGRFPRHADDPLGLYLESLVAIAALEPDRVFPGHGQPFVGGAERARSLVEHHEERVDACVAAVRQLVDGSTPGGATAFDAATLAFSRVFARDVVNATDQRFATTETLAHLEYARRRGAVRSSDSSDGTVRYLPS